MGQQWISGDNSKLDYRAPGWITNPKVAGSNPECDFYNAINENLINYPSSNYLSWQIEVERIYNSKIRQITINIFELNSPSSIIEEIFN